MTDINAWNAIDDSNNVASPAGWPEGMMPSGVNNSARAMMGSIKRWRDQAQPTVVATGSANAQIITYPVAPAALATGDCFTFFSQGTNTGPVTLQVNAQAAKAVRSALNVALIGGEMPAGTIVRVYYDGTNFRLAGDPAAIKKTGDVMTGQLTVPSIVYSANPANGFAFSWDGSATHVIINGADVGTIGDISSVAAGNGLSGGGTTGALSLAMSGSFSGSFVATGDVVAGNNFYTSTGTLTAARVQSSGDSNASGNMNCSYNINAGANITAAGTISGAYLYSSGNVNGTNVNATNNVNANAFVANNNAAYYGKDTGGTPQALIQMASDNVVHIAVGGAAVCNGTFGCNNHIYSTSNGVAYCGLAANAWAGVVSFSFPAPSDQRLKTDIADLPDNCSALVGAITPKRYRWRDGVNALDPARTHWGFIAQEIGAAFAAAGLDFGGHTVGDDDDHTEALDTGELVSVLWGAVKELMARVEQLETALVR